MQVVTYSYYRFSKIELTLEGIGTSFWIEEEMDGRTDVETDMKVAV